MSQLEYPPRLELARLPTPLEHLERASAQWGCGKRIWIKRDDLTGSTLTGNKVRKLEFIAAFAVANQYDVLVTCGGVQSNHCRATALVASQLGLRSHLVLRADGESHTGNFLLDQLAGASVDLFDGDAWGQNLKAAYAQIENAYAEAGLKALMIPTGGSDSLGIWGYIAAAEELGADLRRLGIERAAVVLATGSAGTQTGLTAGAAIHDLPLAVTGYAVCDDAEWFNARVQSDWRRSVERWPQLPDLALQPVTRDHSVGPGYGKAAPEVYRTIVELTRLEGIVLDPVYTGKAFHGLIEDLGAGGYADQQDIVFVHTGGVFGLFAHEQELMQAAGRLE